MVYKKKKKSKGRKMANEMMGGAMGLVGGAAGMGLGSQVLGSVGGASSVHGQQALSNMSGFMPVMGKTMGAGMAIGALGELSKPMKKKRKKKMLY